MVDPRDDFAGYAESLKAAEAASQQHQAMMDQHEHWRQTTWGGWVVQNLQKMGDHLSPFVGNVSQIMADESNLSRILMFSLIRIMIILVVIGIVYAMARIFQSMLGDEIITEEEVVVIHEFDTEEEAQKARAAASRGKKQKSS